MNDNKIAFITAVSDENQYAVCLNHLRKLVLPDGYIVEVIAIRGAKSLCSAYNEAMSMSDAKYKIYLHQDLFILNLYFLVDILNIFRQNLKIGLIGVAGCETLPLNGVWWEGTGLRGKVMEQRDVFSIIKFNECEQPYCVVNAIDGIIMITQYDIVWREDLFTGFHFYDVSQSLEFLKNDYLVCVPQQKDPWVLHACGVVINMDKYNEYQGIFIKYYLT